MKKKCTKCGQEKELSKFYNKKNGKYGKHSECKACLVKRSTKWKKENPEKIRIYEEINRQILRAAFADLPKTNYERIHERTLAAYEQYCKKRMHALAHNLLNYGVRRGFIIKHDKCMFCGSTDHIEGHHPDYSDPLTVLWLCKSCHAQQHNRCRYGREMDTESIRP